MCIRDRFYRNLPNSRLPPNLQPVSYTHLDVYKRQDLLALPGLISGYNKDLSFQKKFFTVFTPHIALQKTWHNQIFNLSYSEGYNAPTAATAFIGGINKPNDDLNPERAKMWDFSIHGLLEHTKFDYQISVFRIDVKDKLTQLSSNANGTNYNYLANTGNQKNQGLEASIGYVYYPEKAFVNTCLLYTSRCV